MSDNHKFQRLKKQQSKKNKSSKWKPYSSKHIRIYKKNIEKMQLSSDTNNIVVLNKKKNKKRKQGKKFI